MITVPFLPLTHRYPGMSLVVQECHFAGLAQNPSYSGLKGPFLLELLEAFIHLIIVLNRQVGNRPLSGDDGELGSGLPFLDCHSLFEHHEFGGDRLLLDPVILFYAPIVVKRNKDVFFLPEIKNVNF